MGRKYRTKNLVNNRSLKRAKSLEIKKKAKRIDGTKNHNDGVGGGSGKPKR